ncbi:MAG: hypothetical protein WC216_01630 [Gallionella sp.]|jgi:hypothetical protein
MDDIKTQHQGDLEHHVKQGLAWLLASAEGENTAALSYAAFELRFAIERIAVHYWATLLNRELEAQDLYDIRSFKRIERRIYELAGYQKNIDGHFEFMGIVLCALKIERPLHTPQIVKLSNYWSDCSELCHIGWPLGCAVPELRKQAFTKLTEISNSLSQHVNSLGWPLLRDAAFIELRNQFIAGSATKKDVEAHIQKTGLWASENYLDGRPPQFIGVPVAPRTSD